MTVQLLLDRVACGMTFDEAADLPDLEA